MKTRRFLVIVTCILFLTSFLTVEASDAVIGFEKVPQNISEGRYTSVVIGPDGRLYATSLFGQIYRWDIGEEGRLENEEMVFELFDRILIGIVFDPNATADQATVWITHNYSGLMTSANFEEIVAPNFSGAVDRIDISGFGTDAETWINQPMLTGLPRSTQDHMVNSLAFGPDGGLYVLVGSASAMGDSDSTWGGRSETLLSASVLRIDIPLLEAQPTLPLDMRSAKMEEDGSVLPGNNFGLGDPQLAELGLYDPLAPNAPVTLYATGLRNTYDLVWHSSGDLYIPINGAAAGGNTPPTPDQLPDSCNHRIDMPLNGAFRDAVPEARGVASQHDYLARIIEGGYYGHPNPTRCEWVMNGGNPTAEVDPGQVGDHYPVGTQPDRNFKGFVFDFGAHKSPNGIIEYQSDVFDGIFQGKLFVANYSSAGNDIEILEPGISPETGEMTILSSQQGLAGLVDLGSPLDLIEDTSTGNLYVIEFSKGTITMLRPGLVSSDNVEEQLDEILTRVHSMTLIGGAKSLGAAGLAGIAGLFVLFPPLYLHRRQLRREPLRILRHILPEIVLSIGMICVGYVLISSARIDLRTARNEMRSYTKLEKTLETAAVVDYEGGSPAAVPISDEMTPGQQLFATNCSACHGMDARGLPNLGLDLVESEFVDDQGKDELIAFIKRGRLPWDPNNITGIGMPANGGNPSLTEQQLEQIVDYLREIEN